MNEVVMSSTVVRIEPEAAAVEALRCLRTCVMAFVKDQGLKTFGVTSSMPEEGKSFIAANLAMVTAQLGKKTLLIDADLRRPGLSMGLKIPKDTPGLGDILSDPNMAPEKIPFLRTDAENLSLICSGIRKRSQAELLEQPELEKLITLAKEMFEVVFIDMPPVLSVTDPVVVNRQLDGTILVIRANKTPEKVAKKAYSILKESGVNVVGSVLNRVKIGTGGYYNYGYYGDNR